MPDLAVIVPTRGRPGNVEKVIGAWDFTNAWDHADLILVVDEDDPHYQEYVDLIDLDAVPLRIFSVPTWRPMVHKLDEAAREMAELYWALGFAGDDHLPRTIGWAARYLTVLRELGTGMVYGDDGYQGRKLSTEWAMTSDVVTALGRMVPAPVEHMFCDNSVMDLFTEAGAIRHLPEVRIEHMHPYAGKADSDDQYQRVNSRDQMGRDRRAYQEWRRGYLANQVAAVRALRSGRPEQRPERSRPVRAPGRGRMIMRPPRFFKRVRAATPDDVMMALADFAAQVPGDQEIVEIGVFHGRTALQLAWGARQGGGAHVTGIDVWDLPGNTYGPPFTDPSTRRWAHHHVQAMGYSRDITLIQGFSHDVATKYVGPPVGLLFVDGDHTKEGARRDIEAWSPHLAPGARIAVDDYGHPDWPGVKEALDELVAEGVLEPVEVFHGALAVTRLATERPYAATESSVLQPTAVTSEGVHPSPEPTDRNMVPPWGPEPSHEPEPETWPITHQHDGEVSNRGVITKDEAFLLGGMPPGREVEDLTIPQLKALAKHRGIVLGVRKDKRAEIIRALRDGR